MEGQGDQLTTASEIMSPLKCEYERVKVELMDIKSSWRQGKWVDIIKVNSWD